MRRGLVWFTEDLRVDDNETLLKAIEENEEVLPVYFWTEHEQKPQFGIPRLGDTRKAFIQESLSNLQQQLHAIGGSLLVLNGSPEDQITDLCKQFSIRKVYTKKQVGSEEKTSQIRVKERLLAIAVDFETYSSSTLFHPDDLPFSVRDIPLLFTKFRKLAEKESVVRSPFNPPEDITVPPFEEVVIERTLSSKPTWLQGGEDHALERLHHFIWEHQAIKAYKETRDQLSGLNFSTKFSAWLSQGCISPRRIYSEIKRYEHEVLANDSTYWVILEV
jgi:deoxyribodipyrimidine photo-lyase